MSLTEIFQRHRIILEKIRPEIELMIQLVANDFTGSLEINFSQGGIAEKILHKKVK